MSARLYTSGSDEHFNAVIAALMNTAEPYAMELNQSDGTTLINALHYSGWNAAWEPFTPDVRNSIRDVLTHLYDRLDAAAPPNAGDRRALALENLRRRTSKLDLRLELDQMCPALIALHYTGFRAPEGGLQEASADLFGSVSVTLGIEAV